MHRPTVDPGGNGTLGIQQGVACVDTRRRGAATLDGVGHLEKKYAHIIIGSMLEILSVARIRSMPQSVTERLHALLLMVISERTQIP